MTVVGFAHGRGTDEAFVLGATVNVGSKQVVVAEDGRGGAGTSDSGDAVNVDHANV